MAFSPKLTSWSFPFPSKSDTAENYPPFPNAAASAGQQIMFEGMHKRKTVVWYSVGQADVIFKTKLKYDIQRFLGENGFTNPEIYLLQYMIGATKERSRPTLVVCGEDTRLLKKVQYDLHQSRILEKDEYLGYRRQVGIRSFPFEGGGHIRELMDDLTYQYHNLRLTSECGGNATSVDWQEQYTDQPYYYYKAPAGQPVSVFASNIDFGPGSRIFVNSNTPDSSIQAATVSAILLISDALYGLTVGHLFEGHNRHHDRNTTWILPEIDDTDFDPEHSTDTGDSSRDITDSGSLMQPEKPEDFESPPKSATLHHDFKPASSSSSTLDATLTRKPDGTEKPSVPVAPEQTTVLIGTRFLHRPDLDCGLFKCNISIPIPDRESRRRMVPIKANRPHILVPVSRPIGSEEIKVFAITSSAGRMPGVLHPTPCLAVSATGGSLQSIYSVSLKGTILYGDCGTPIINEDDALLGQIVKGVAGSSTAYMMSIVDIFDDIISCNLPKVLMEWQQAGQSLPPKSAADFSPQQFGSDVSSTAASSNVGYDMSEYGTDVSGYTAPSSYLPTDGYTAMTESDIPVQVRLPCEFLFLGLCDRTYPLDQESRWRDHIEERHLKLKYPSKCMCWFCNTTFDADKTSRGDKHANFELRLDHLRDHLRDNEYTAHNMRPDSFLMKHAYKQNLIDEDTYNHVIGYSEVPEEIRLISSGKERAHASDRRQQRDSITQFMSTVEEDRRRKQDAKEQAKKEQERKKVKGKRKGRGPT